jgi:hypothetical protein
MIAAGCSSWKIYYLILGGLLEVLSLAKWGFAEGSELFIFYKFGEKHKLT